MINNHILFSFPKISYLTYLWIFLEIFGVFPNICFVNFESACRSNQTIKRLEIGKYGPCRIANELLSPFFFILETTSGYI